MVCVMNGGLDGLLLVRAAIHPGADTMNPLHGMRTGRPVHVCMSDPSVAHGVLLGLVGGGSSFVLGSILLGLSMMCIAMTGSHSGLSSHEYHMPSPKLPGCVCASTTASGMHSISPPWTELNSLTRDATPGRRVSTGGHEVLTGSMVPRLVGNGRYAVMRHPHRGSDRVVVSSLDLSKTGGFWEILVRASELDGVKAGVFELLVGVWGFLCVVTFLCGVLLDDGLERYLTWWSLSVEGVYWMGYTITRLVGNLEAECFWMLFALPVAHGCAWVVGVSVTVLYCMDPGLFIHRMEDTGFAMVYMGNNLIHYVPLVLFVVYLIRRRHLLSELVYTSLSYSYAESDGDLLSWVTLVVMWCSMHLLVPTIYVSILDYRHSYQTTVPPMYMLSGALGGWVCGSCYFMGMALNTQRVPVNLMT